MSASALTPIRPLVTFLVPLYALGKKIEQISGLLQMPAGQDAETPLAHLVSTTLVRISLSHLNPGSSSLMRSFGCDLCATMRCELDPTV